MTLYKPDSTTSYKPSTNWEQILTTWQVGFSQKTSIPSEILSRSLNDVGAYSWSTITDFEVLDEKI